MPIVPLPLAELAQLDARTSSLLSATLTQLAAGSWQAPLLPAVAMELHSMSNDPDISFDRVAQRAVTDPNVAGRIMAIASSPAFGTRPPTGVKEALGRLGADGMRQVAFDAAFAARILRRGAHLDVVERAVRHARATSALCRILAADVGAHPGTAALTGLLHGLGAVVVVDALSPSPRRRPQAPVTAVPGHVVIHAVHMLHAWCSARAAATFHLPADVVSALAEHHGNKSGPLARLLCLTDHLSPSEPGARALPLEQALAISGLDLEPQRLMRKLEPLLASFDEARVAAGA